MYCPKCGAEITHYSKYCRKCGTKLPYNKEFEKDKSDASEDDEKSLTANRQIIFLSVLGLIIIIMISAFAIGAFNQQNPSNTNSSLDDFINTNLVSSSEDSEEVEYYYQSSGYEVPKNNEDSKLSDISNSFINYDFFNKSI